MNVKSETLNSIKERRSIRAYKQEQIKDEELNLVLEAGTYAPTGMGKQSPKMVVVQDEETIQMLSKLNAEVMGVNSDPFYGAPTVIIVFADSNVHTYVEDGSLVIGNLMLAAYAVGLGSCWINRAKEVFAGEEGKKLMAKWGVPDNYVGIGHCILGYTDGEIPKAKDRKPDYILKV
jgi:nitroreductase